MRTETFRGRDLHGVMALARAKLGEDALMVRTRWVREGGRGMVEVIATTPAELRRAKRRLELGASAALASGERHVVALIGPTGAGKTTTAAKLALHPDAFGGRRVGLVTLDTYRVAALEQIQTYADIAGLPCEAVFDDEDVERVLGRLADCDVLVVDSPGRSPRGSAEDRAWHALLARLEPAEVHLVLPATIRPDIARAQRDEAETLGVTHALITKLDEVPGEDGVLELAEAVDLPIRWVADGQEVPRHLRGAGRLLGSLGFEELVARAG